MKYMVCRIQYSFNLDSFTWYNSYKKKTKMGVDKVVEKIYLYVRIGGAEQAF